MSRKHKATRNNSTEGKKPLDRTVIYAALIGLAGTVVAGFFSLMNTRTQILLPISLTEVSLTQTLLPTKTSIPNYTATPGVCDSGTIPLATPVPIDSKPTLIVVTIDEGVTWLTLENVLVSLDNSLRMGDRVIILLDGKQKFSDAVIVDESVTSYYVEPALPPSPTPFPTTTPTQVQNPIITALQKKAATATAQAAMIQATQMSDIYSCSASYWNYSYQSIYLKWQQENVSEFVKSLRQKIQVFNFGNPSQAKSEGLVIASNIFDYECSKQNYEKCIFIPMTVMQEWREQPSNDIEVNFSNVDVVGTMTDCFLYDSTCRDKIEYWQSFFTKNNARSVQFVNLNDFWNLVANIIGQQG